MTECLQTIPLPNLRAQTYKSESFGIIWNPNDLIRNFIQMNFCFYCLFHYRLENWYQKCCECEENMLPCFEFIFTLMIGLALPNSDRIYYTSELLLNFRPYFLGVVMGSVMHAIGKYNNMWVSMANVVASWLICVCLFQFLLLSQFTRVFPEPLVFQLRCCFLISFLSLFCWSNSNRILPARTPNCTYIYRMYMDSRTIDSQQTHSPFRTNFLV